MKRPRKASILIIEDDRTQNVELARFFRRHGFSCSTTADGADGMTKALEKVPDVIILDWQLPSLSGPEVVRAIKPHLAHSFMVIVSVRNDPTERVHALALGADDYFHKPIPLQELLLKIHGSLKIRYAPNDRIIESQFITINADNRVVILALEETGDSIELDTLSTKEFDLLWYLMTSSGKVLQREQLMDSLQVAEKDYRVIDHYVNRLRKKLRDGMSLISKNKNIFNSAYPIRTYLGVGYKFTCEFEQKPSVLEEVRCFGKVAR